MRHVVEHLINAEKNLSSLISNEVIDKNGLLIIEVPNGEKTLSEAKLTDFFMSIFLILQRKAFKTVF